MLAADALCVAICHHRSTCCYVDLEVMHTLAIQGCNNDTAAVLLCCGHGAASKPSVDCNPYAEVDTKLLSSADIAVEREAVHPSADPLVLSKTSPVAACFLLLLCLCSTTRLFADQAYKSTSLKLNVKCLVATQRLTGSPRSLSSRVKAADETTPSL